MHRTGHAADGTRTVAALPCLGAYIWRLVLLSFAGALSMVWGWNYSYVGTGPTS
jgi:hypothetical protein